MKTYQDKITQKTIAFDDNTLFVIKTRAGFNKKLIKRVFLPENVSEAFREFYSMVVTKNQYKYLFMMNKDEPNQEGDLVLRMKGQISKEAHENFILKNKRVKSKMTYASIGNLSKCPVTLSRELESQNFMEYPASIFKWTNQKLIYALLAYLFSLDKESKKELLMKADKELFKHKEMSGFPIDDLNKIKVDVVSLNELL
jgi:hypothetical protein